MGSDLKIGKKIQMEDLIKWTASEVLVNGAAISGASPHVCSISTDSRTINAEDFFVPIIGENFDGHDFIHDSVKQGCMGIVFQEEHLHDLDRWKSSIKRNIWDKLVILQVKSTIDFLLGLAKNYIRQFDVKVIGITGSVGKTTSKDFLVNILSRRFNIVFTPENYNTEIGVTKSVLEINNKTEIRTINL